MTNKINKEGRGSKNATQTRLSNTEPQERRPTGPPTPKKRENRTGHKAKHEWGDYYN
jgi:hypothetical protein